MCIAGVFGGLDSGVTGRHKEQKSIEKRIFQSTRVRRTAQRQIVDWMPHSAMNAADPFRLYTPPDLKYQRS